MDNNELLLLLLLLLLILNTGCGQLYRKQDLLVLQV